MRMHVTASHRPSCLPGLPRVFFRRRQCLPRRLHPRLQVLLAPQAVAPSSRELKEEVPASMTMLHYQNGGVGSEREVLATFCGPTPSWWRGYLQSWRQLKRDLCRTRSMWLRRRRNFHCSQNRNLSVGAVTVLYQGALPDGTLH